VNSGQLAYVKALVAFITAAVGKSVNRKTTKKGGRRKRSADSALPDQATLIQHNGPQASDWGLFEPIRQIFEILSMFAPPSSLVIGILAATVLALLYRSPPPAHGTHRLSRTPGYYEGTWGGEETELWKWIEERVEIRDALSHYTQKRTPHPASFETLAEQEVTEAIRVTKERLGFLEQAVERKRNEKLEQD
jgi:hypothetical protein